MTDTTCTCGRPTAGAVLCERCRATFAHALVHVGVYSNDLETVITKRTRYGTTGATKSAIGKAQPLPLDGRFVDRTGSGSKIQHDVRNTLSTWCRTVLEDLAPRVGPACLSCIHASCTAFRRDAPPRDTVSSMVNYLARQHRFVLAQTWAPVILTELLDLERRLGRMINRPADRWYAGKCSAPDYDDPDGEACTAELYATADSGELVCQACGTRHDVAARRDFLLEEAKGYSVTATEAAGALLAWTDYGGSEAKLVDRIRKWRDRNQLEVREVTSLLGRDRHLYRLGDIQELLIGDAQVRQTRGLKAPA